MNSIDALPPNLGQVQEMMQSLGIVRTMKHGTMSDVQKLVDVLFQPHKGTLYFGVEDDFETVCLRVAAGSLKKGDKEIRKITCCFNMGGYTLDMPVDTVTPKCRFSLTYADGTKQGLVLPDMLPVKAGISFVFSKYVALVDMGADVEGAFIHQSKREVLEWDQVMSLADPIQEIYYQQSRAQIASIFVSKVKEKANGRAVELFSFGCGNGHDIDAVQKALTKELGYQPKAYGMDATPEYFDATIEGVSLTEGNLTTIGNWLKDKVSLDSLQMGLFMGTLTSGVSASSYAGLQSLHAVKNFNLVVEAGYTPFLLTKSICKASGWKVELKSTNSYFNGDPASRLIFKQEGVMRPDIRNVYILEPMNEDERKSYLEARGTRRSSKQVFDCLDLSCSSKPERDLQLFDTLTAHRLVDISWCDFTEESLQAFVADLETRIGDSIALMASSDEPWFASFCKITSEKIGRIQRLDHKVGEIAPFAPATAKRIGVYKSMPFQQV